MLSGRDVLVCYKAEVGGSKKRRGLCGTLFYIEICRIKELGRVRGRERFPARRTNMCGGPEVELTLPMEKRGQRCRLLR